MKLGKLAPKIDPRTLELKTVWNPFAPSLPPLPIVDFDWTTLLPSPAIGMMLNDQIGLCTIAGFAHLVQVMTLAHRGVEVTIADADVLAAYKALTKKVNGREYDPSDPTTDTGLACLDVLNFARTDGIGGHKIGGFAKLNHLDQNEMRAAGHAYGGLYTGLALPLAAQSQVGSLWTRTGDPTMDMPGSWGGHCGPIVAASTPRRKYATWGRADQASDDDWSNTYVDEAYVLFSQDWVDGTAPAPSGLDVNALRSYLDML